MSDDVEQDEDDELLHQLGHEGRDRDGSLRDLQEDGGDEVELDDLYCLDRLSAAQTGVELDGPSPQETPLS